ncbi:MAG: type II secretion system F family protein [Verrucomicrobiales bacterium]|nr:type II secretion system F family protein [Verrucomicrobiales bacterium]
MSGLSAKAKSQLYSSLEKYARSGMGMEKACESLLQQPRVRGAEKKIYRGILAGLSAGLTIGDSLGRASGEVTALEEEVVSAAEEGGMLEKGFGHLAEYFRRMDRTRRRILKGLTYPLILIHLAVPVSTLTVTAFSSFSADGLSQGQGFQSAFTEMGKNMLIAYVIISLIFLAAKFLAGMARTSALIDGLLNTVPLLGKARRAVAMERFSQVFEIFLQSGKKMSDSLAGAGAASGSGLIRTASRRGAKIVAEGNPLATALYSARSAFPNDFARGMDSAEQSGQLDRELAEWGRFYSDSAKEAMEQLAEWTPKLFYWGILILVGFLIIRAGLAYRDLLQNLINVSF